MRQDGAKDRKLLSEELGKLLSEARTVGFMRAALEGALNLLKQLEIVNITKFP